MKKRKKPMRRREKQQIKTLSVCAAAAAVLLLTVWACIDTSIPWTALETPPAVEATQPPTEEVLPPATTAPPETEAPTQAPTEAPTEPIPVDDPLLTLVNPWNLVPEDWEVNLVQLRNGQSVDERCYPDLQQMMDDCRAAGLNPVIVSSYRTRDKQKALFDNKVTRVMASGVSAEEAPAVAAREVAMPDTSEHQLGLAVDIVDNSNWNLDESQEKTAVQQWLMKHSWEYGFLLRYPVDKTDVTGIIYEPWHYRYVGREYAQAIHEKGVCLEEFLNP